MSQDKLEELLKLASMEVELEIKSQPKRIIKPISKFILEKQIRSGNDKVPAFVVYQTFLDWAREGTETNYNIGTGVFYRHFSSMFDTYSDSGERGYKLDASSFDMSVGYRVRSRMSRDQRNEARRKKKEKDAS